MSDNPFAIPEVQGKTEPPPKRSISKWRTGILLIVVVGVVMFFLLPTLTRARHVARWAHCKNNLQQIGLALYNYHDEYGSFPPAYTVNSKGRPMHSWRTLLLPYLEQEELYRRIDLSKPWNDPANAAVFAETVAVFRCPMESIKGNHAIYLAVNGHGFCFDADKSTSVSEITDSRSNTLVIIEVPLDHTVPWMSPQDADTAMILGIGEGSKMAHFHVIQGVWADGSVRPLGINLDRSILKSKLTISGNDNVDEF